MTLKQELLALQEQIVQVVRDFDRAKEQDRAYQEAVVSLIREPVLLRAYLDRYHAPLRRWIEQVRQAMEMMVELEGVTGWLYVADQFQVVSYPLTWDILWMDGDLVFGTPEAIDPDPRPWWRETPGIAGNLDEEQVTPLSDGRLALWSPTTCMERPFRNHKYAEVRFQRYRAKTMRIR